MLSNPSNSDVNPDLLAAEIKKMESSVINELNSTEDAIAYGKKELSKHLIKGEIVKALAFFYLFEGNTGVTLNVKDLISENDHVSNVDYLPYIGETIPLADAVDNLNDFIKIYFK